MDNNTITLNGGLHITKAEPIDDRLLGDSLNEYLARVPIRLRYVGLNPTIVINGVSKKYIFKTGVANADLILDLGDGNQEQSDWSEQDNQKPTFILNKPVIPSLVKANWTETNVNSPAFIQNKPVIPGGNIKPDWDAEAGDPAEILNKPTILTGQVKSNWTETNQNDPSFILNKPTIPAPQVQPDWNATSGLGVILNKPVVPGVPNITSSDNSIKINGFDISSNKHQLELFATSESEFNTVWALATASDIPVTIYIIGEIVFSANTNFVLTGDHKPIIIQGLNKAIWNSSTFNIKTNNLIFKDVAFKTASYIYMYLVGGIINCFNCSWISDTVQGSSNKTHFIVEGSIVNGLANIYIDGISHNTTSIANDTNDLLQPFAIVNNATFAGAYDVFKVTLLNFSAGLNGQHTSRVYLGSSIANCPYKVTGDNSWTYISDQPLPGFSNISATAKILKESFIDVLYASRLQLNTSPTYTLGMTDEGKVVKMQTIDDSMIYTIIFPDGSSVLERCTNINLSINTEIATWTLEPYDVNANDLLITHDLNRHLVSVTIFSIDIDEETLLVGNAAFAGIKTFGKNKTLIAGLATIRKGIRINLIFK